MLGRLRSSLSYANVMATIAVFISLGGASYAALNLPRNSVGAKQIKEDAVGPSEVKNRSLGLTELQRRAVSALQGEKGDPGATGPPGPPGRDATPADFAGEATRAIAAAPTADNQCTAIAQFCTGTNDPGGLPTPWTWRNLGAGWQPGGFWKDRAGVVHLEGLVELFGSSGGGQPPAFILPEGYRPAATRRFTVSGAVGTLPTDAQVLRFVDVRPNGQVDPELGGGGFVSLNGISFRP